MTPNSQTSSPYTYLSAGFNRFFMRSIASNPANGTLLHMSNNSNANTLNFDQLQTGGSLGDKIQVGGITIDGTKRRISIKGVDNVDMGWIGNLNSD